MDVVFISMPCRSHWWDSFLLDGNDRSSSRRCFKIKHGHGHLGVTVLRLNRLNPVLGLRRCPTPCRDSGMGFFYVSRASVMQLNKNTRHHVLTLREGRSAIFAVPRVIVAGGVSKTLHGASQRVKTRRGATIKPRFLKNNALRFFIYIRARTLARGVTPYGTDMTRNLNTTSTINLTSTILLAIPMAMSIASRA